MMERREGGEEGERGRWALQVNQKGKSRGEGRGGGEGERGCEDTQVHKGGQIRAGNDTQVGRSTKGIGGDKPGRLRQEGGREQGVGGGVKIYPENEEARIRGGGEVEGWKE